MIADSIAVAAALGAAGDPVALGFAQPRQAVLALVTFVVLSVLVAGSSALAYRWYFRDEIPEGVTVLLGVSVVALYLNTTSLGAIAAGGSPGLLAPESAFFNIVALGASAVAAPVGRYGGDRLAVDVFALSGARQLEGELSGIVRAVGRFTAVTLPAAADIEDIETYDPVSPEKKEELGEKTLLFARKLTPEELRSRLVTRLKEEYAVGYVDVDLTADGEIEYLAVGSRVAGLGPVLAPGTAAIAVAADPPNNATAGDRVQVWRTEPEPKRVATGELRGVAGDAATVALDESDAEKLTAEAGYRLVTLPSEPQADREFASLLRRVDETMATITVQAGSALVDTTVGDVGLVVAAVRPSDGGVQPIPPRSYAFAPGDRAYLVGRPDALRRLEGEAAAASGAEPAAGDSTDETIEDERDDDTAVAEAAPAAEGADTAERAGAGDDPADDGTQRS